MTLETIQINEAQVKDAVELFEFIGGNSADALRVAINRAGPKTRTAASKSIRGQVRLKARYVNERLKFERATRNKPSGRITTRDRGLLLSRFLTDSKLSDPNKVSWIKPPPPPPRGIKVKVKPKGASKDLSAKPTTHEPFFMVLPNSRRLAIVARRKQAGPKGGKIDVYYGPSLSQVFDSERDVLIPQAGETLTEELGQAMNALLRKQFPKE